MPTAILATAGYDHTIRFWEAPSGVCYRTIHYNDSVSLKNEWEKREREKRKTTSSYQPKTQLTNKQTSNQRENKNHLYLTSFS
jgi:hypothetical protein